jgi:tripartite-type tricarboxylate transporter receptor subunit TctC
MTQLDLSRPRNRGFMNRLNRRVSFAALALLGLGVLGQAAAQTYPMRPVRLVVPYATGGGSDVLARQIAAVLQQNWGQGVAVENKAGASGTIGTVEVVRATPDGYTLLVQNSTMLTNLALSDKLPYDPFKDLTPIMLLGNAPIAVVAHPSSGINDLKDLIAASKAKPGGLSYGSCGAGTPQHFVMELLKQKTGIPGVNISYKGCSPALNDVLAGQIPLAVVSANLLPPHVKTGKLKVIGVASTTRYAALPDSPTFEEMNLKPFDIGNWYALMGPAKLPPELVQKISADVNKVLADGPVQSKLQTAGVDSYKGNADDLAKLIRAEAQRYSQLAKSANIKAE